MGRKSAIYEANALTEKKRSFLFLLTSKVDTRAQRNIFVTADDANQAQEYVNETYPIHHSTILAEAKGGVII